MKQRDAQHNLAHQTSNINDWKTFRAQRQDVKRKINQSEREYVKSEITANKENKTSIWKTIRRRFVSSSNPRPAYPRDCTEVANGFNEFFVSVGERAAEQANN